MIRNVGLLNHAPGRKTYANLYDKNQIAVNFEDRRTKTDEVRRMVPDANFSYLSCIEFIKYFISLNDENS
ncbi:MAG: hypothetical protein IPK08_06400 [Bacteroidetes bacterium]|nr:hypothetical protein [Bacteroidota bacterium]